MRILIYIEPFPIRNTFTHFDAVARRFLPLLNSNAAYDVRFFGNDATLNMLGEAALAKHSMRLIRPTESEQAVIKGHMYPWQSEGMATWLELMEGIGDVTEDYLSILRRIWLSFPFEVIIHWGENGAIKRFVDERPVTKIGMELGCTRPPFLESVAMDPFGTNGSAVVPRLTVADLREIVGNMVISCHEAMLRYSQNLESRGYEDQFLPLPEDITSRLSSEDKVVFFPLQLFDDANLLRFSRYSTIEDVVLDVVPKLAENGYTVLIKPHPASHQRQSAATANVVARAALRPWWNKVIWCDHVKPIPNARLISIADFVVTVNSSVGFEALYFDKPVVVLGDAVYKPRDLFPTLNDMLLGQFDLPSYKEGVGYLRSFMLGAYLQQDCITSDASAFLGCIGAIDGVCRDAPGDPMAFARLKWGSAVASLSLSRSSMFWGKSVPGTAEFAQPVRTPNSPPLRRIATNAYALIAQRLWLHARKPNLEVLLSWIDAAWHTPDELVQIIRIGKLVDAAFYLEKNPDIRAGGIDPFIHFVHHGMFENRSPQAAIGACTPDDIRENLKQAVIELISQQEELVFPLKGEEEESRQEQLKHIATSLSKRDNRIAVVAHLYYRDLAPAILQKLAAITESFDLIVTLPDWGIREIKETVLKFYPDAMFYQTANRGRDIGPFVDLLPLILKQNYDAVLKIQTKRGYYMSGRLLPQLGDLWREDALDALLGNSNRVASILDAFRADPTLSMIGPSPYFQAFERYPYHDGGQLASMLLDSPADGGFFAGTMFWLRPSCIKPLQALSLPNFAPENGKNDGALAHLVERMFGHAAANSGRIAGAPVDLDEPVNHDLELSDTTLHDYLSRRYEEQRNLAKQKSSGQLIW